MLKKFSLVAGIVLFAAAMLFTLAPNHAFASGGSGGGGGGGGGSTGDTIKVSKAEYAASNHTMLVKAASSDPNARLMVYLPTGEYVHDVQNGGGSRYGGTVIFMLTDPGHIVIRSSSGGSITVATTPFQP